MYLLELSSNKVLIKIESFVFKQYFTAWLWKSFLVWISVFCSVILGKITKYIFLRHTYHYLLHISLFKTSNSIFARLKKSSQFKSLLVIFFCIISSFLHKFISQHPPYSLFRFNCYIPLTVNLQVFCIFPYYFSFQFMFS